MKRGCSNKETFTDNERDRETEEERQGEVHVYVAICNLLNEVN